MSEISKFEAYKKKLQGICDENNLVFRFRNQQYPVTLTIRPVSGFGEQLSMLESADSNYTSPDASIVFAFEDGAITYKMSERFTISETLFNKIKNLFKNMHSCWLQYFFRCTVQSGALDPRTMPVIDEGAAEEIEAIPSDSDDEDESDFISPDDALVRRAIEIVRAENKASVALLQRRLNIGFSKAGRLLDELEALGVVGAYNGGEPREVLPTDVPDDEIGGELNG